jgi:putative phosphoesterase
MKILVISDTHKNLSNVIKTMKNIKDIDRIIHLGDNIVDAEDLESIYNIPIDCVAGNCDFYSNQYPKEKIINLNNNKIFITHGHLYNVKKDISTIRKIGIEKKVDVILFGHTHISHLSYVDNILIMNPGSISLPRGSNEPSYGVLDIDEDGKIHPNLKELNFF